MEQEQRLKALETGLGKQKEAEKELERATQLLTAHINNSPMAVIEFNSQSRVIRWAGEAERMFGWTAEEILGKSISEIKWVYDNDKESVKQESADLISGERSSSLHVNRNYRKDGSVILCEWYNSSIYDPQGNLLSLLSLVLDITERKQMEETLRKSEAKFRFLAENMTDIVWMTDTAFNTTYVSPSIEKVLGYTPEERKKQTIEEQVTPDSLKHILERYQREQSRAEETGIDHQGAVTIEVEYYHKDGFTVWMENNVQSVSDKDGNIIQFYGVSRNITERKRAEQALRDSEEKLARLKKMESLGLLAGGVAHDLNNVLSGIVSYPELLLMDLPDDSKYKKPIETIQESGNKAAAIVQDLLTVARGVATTKESLNLNKLIDEYLNSPEFDKLVQYHPTVTYKTNLNTDLLNICGSRIHVGKVIMNLISNASEAIQGSGNVTISTMNRYVDRPFRGYDDVNIGEYAILSVSDDGTGISSGDLDRIFEPFYTKKIMGRSGTGLGLAVVWNVVQDHKGYIDVTSGENGTLIELYFPITRIEITDIASPSPIKNYQGNGETILVIDDVASQREISCAILNKLGYEAKAVSSGEEAIEYMHAHRVDLLFLDMIMDPGINGRETYKQIKAIHPNQKAIIVSGFAETEEVKETQKLGAGQYIRKPVTLSKIGMAVKDELGK